MCEVKKVMKELDKCLFLNENVPEEMRMRLLTKLKPPSKAGRIAHSEEKTLIIKKLKSGYYGGKNAELRKDLEKIMFDLSWANLQNANLTSLDLQNVNLTASLLMGSDFSGSNMSQANLSISDVSGAYFSQSILQSSDFTIVNGDRANFSGADLQMANFRGALLTSANFSMANCSMADMSDCDLANANFDGANIHETSIENSIITGTIFEKIIENKNEEKKRYHSSEFSGSYKTKSHTYKGKEHVYAVKHHYTKKGNRYK